MAYKDPEVKKQKDREYREIHKEEHKAYCRVHYRMNKERYRQKNKEWKMKHPDSVKQLRQESAERRRIDRNARARANHALHREERNRKKREWYAKRRLIVFQHYGMVCACCGESHAEFLTIDHVNNDGAKHRREIGETNSLLFWLIRNNFPTGFQTLCWNCNCAKGHYGYCPHNPPTECKPHAAEDIQSSGAPNRQPLQTKLS